MAKDPRAIMARFNQLKSERAASETYWQQVADYILPSREFTRKTTPGSRRTAPMIYNTTPVLALEQLAGALHGMLTSPSLRWFALRPSDQDIADDPDVQAWFEAVTDRMYGVFTGAISGFDVSLHELYLDLSGFGTGCIFIADKGRNGLHFEARPLAECFVAQGADGQIDTLFRAYQLPLREVVRLWPRTTPKPLQEQAEKNPDQMIDIVHAVQPHDAARSAWDSDYVLTSQIATLETGTFQSFPYAVPRWMKRSGETYGFGPGMSVLPDVKLLNKIEELNLRGLAKTIDPAMLLPDDGFLNAPTTAPGAFNYFRSGAPGMDKIGPLVTGARPEVAEKYIEILQDRVRRGFYVDWMNLPQQPNMTATEVLQRRDEMLRLLGPMVSRVTSELLGPVIERTFMIMAANDNLPPMPQALKGRGYRVEYLSPLATAQKASDAEAVMRWFGALAQLAQVDPTVVDVVNSEAAARFLASRMGAPASVVRSQAEIDAKRQQQQQMQQQQQEMQAAQAAAKTAQGGTAALTNLQQLLQGGAAPAAANGAQPPNAAAA